MNLLSEIKHLTYKEIKLEWRQKYAFNGLLLYVIATIYICYLSFKSIIDPPTWNALFWIIMLFAAVNAIAKSFVQENESRLLYYYTLASPQAVILSKIIYNCLLMLLLSVFNFLFYSLLIGNIVQDMGLFTMALFLGCMGFATVLTMVAAIAAKAGHNSTLMAILSFPILIPLLITVIKLSKNAIDGLDWSVSYQYILILTAINAMVVALSFILFPYLWRD
jgi:heme exporter protein B